MSEKRHRSGGGGGRGKQVLAWAGWGILIAFLGTQLVYAYINEQDGTPQGFLTPDLLQSAGFWVPISAAWLFALLGLFWTSKAYKHSERASLLWAKRGYVLTILGGLTLAIVTFEPEAFPRAWLAVVAAGVFGAQTVFFALLARAEYRRAETGEGTRHPRRHAERPAVPPVSPMPQSPAGSAESPGAPR